MSEKRIIKKKDGLHGMYRVPGDKSISHRALMLGSIAKGDTHIEGFLEGEDCLSTMKCLRDLGVDIEQKGNGRVTVHGVGLYGLKDADAPLFVGNSGTTIRLLSGILAGQDYTSFITGDDSIKRRPMDRIIKPLRLMGSGIEATGAGGCAPLIIPAGRLHGIEYEASVASAQVKSCVLLAGLYAAGETVYTEPSLSRNHTELMLKAMGANIVSNGPAVVLESGDDLYPLDIEIPGDISSASYLMGAALITPDSEITIENVGINPTRSGIIDCFKRMGARIEIANKWTQAGEDIADIIVRSSDLHATEIGGDIIPRLIDELPLIAVAAAFAEGTTVIRDAAELKVKESDRIKLVTKNLLAMGADVKPLEDGFIINGIKGRKKALEGTIIDDAYDHRIAMAFAVAALAAEGETVIEHPECVSISYPAFFEDLI